MITILSDFGLRGAIASVDRLFFEDSASIYCSKRGEFRFENCVIGSSTGFAPWSLMFVIYINDISHYFLYAIFAFSAGDFEIFMKIVNEMDERLFQGDLENVEKCEHPYYLIEEIVEEC